MPRGRPSKRWRPTRRSAGRCSSRRRGRRRVRCYNAALLLAGGRIVAIRYKHELPNYGVFDEKRVFAAGPLPAPVDFRGMRLGVLICEDMWFPTVAAHLAKQGAEILIVPNGSPFERGKVGQRVALASERVRETGLPLVYVNQVGGQDELVFDGGSFVVGHDQELVVQLPVWTEATRATCWTRASGRMDVRAAAARADRRRARQHLSGDDGRPARLREQEPLSRRPARHVGRHRLGVDCGRRRRCARSGTRARRAAAVAIHQ